MRVAIFMLQIFLLWSRRRGVYKIAGYIIPKIVVVRIGRSILATYFLSLNIRNIKKYKKIKQEKMIRKQEYLERLKNKNK